MLDISKQFLSEKYGVSPEIAQEVSNAELTCTSAFSRVQEICEFNQAKVLHALQAEQVAVRHFSGTTGYGYDDIGRDTLERVFARAFGCEDALVRPQISSGTHALALSLFGLLMPGDQMLSITGKPYDTLEECIGLSGEAWGSLKSYGIEYGQVELLSKGGIDISAVLSAIQNNTRMVYIQRSRGYAWRDSLSIDEIELVCLAVRKIRPDMQIVVDNCYGEFTDTREPVQVGADVIVGSLIKNPGGGIAPTGAYLAGTKRCIEKIANRLTSPGIGREVGSWASGYATFFQGFFMAPHVVAQAIKGAILAAKIFADRGFRVMPLHNQPRNDIIQAINFDSSDQLTAFCQSIQAASPVDSHVTPYPWDMPGYQHQVIMAAGAFVQGASIELSADAPIVEPYVAYLQGGLTYEHVKIAIMIALSKLS